MKRRAIQLIKDVVLAAYVHMWSPMRNAARSLAGRSHVVVVNYHRVSDEFKDPVTVGVAQFRRQMEILRREFTVLDMATFLSERGRPRRRAAVVITVDDGYEDNYRAAQVMREMKLPCTFFICTGIVGTDRAFEHDVQLFGCRAAPLAWGQVREMAAWGFLFGNHTASHANLRKIDFAEAKREVEAAAADLVREVGGTGAKKWLSYPYGKAGDISEEVRAALPGWGIEHVFSAYGGTNPPDFNKLDILRQGVSHGFSDLGFRAMLQGWRVRM